MFLNLSTMLDTTKRDMHAAGLDYRDMKPVAEAMNNLWNETATAGTGYWFPDTATHKRHAAAFVDAVDGVRALNAPKLDPAIRQVGPVKTEYTPEELSTRLERPFFRFETDLFYEALGNVGKSEAK